MDPLEFNKTLITASPCQNLDITSERVIHRFIPLLVAENFMRVREYESGKEMPRIDLWNCIGMRMDKSFRSQNKYNSRKEFSSALLEDKYNILRELGIQSKGRLVIRDDDESTKEWIINRLEQLISLGIIYKEKREVDICSHCDYLQSLANTYKHSCTFCGSKDFHQDKKEVLMINIPEDRYSLTEGRIIHPKNTKHIQSFFDQLPPWMMISKVREYGVSLDLIGLPEYVLDPKIGVALMSELVAERYDLSEIVLVQGVAIAANTIPYTSIMTSKLNHKYVLLPKIPNTTLEEARNLGIGFIGRYLPLVLLEHKENMTPSQLDSARTEYIRILDKLDNIVPRMNHKGGKVLNLNPEDLQCISEISRDLISYNIREGRKKIHNLFRSLGQRYCEEIRGTLNGFNPNDMKDLENIMNLFYKQ